MSWVHGSRRSGHRTRRSCICPSPVAGDSSPNTSCLCCHKQVFPPFSSPSFSAPRSRIMYSIDTKIDSILLFRWLPTNYTRQGCSAPVGTTTHTNTLVSIRQQRNIPSGLGKCALFHDEHVIYEYGWSSVSPAIAPRVPASSYCVLASHSPLWSIRRYGPKAR